MKNSESFFKNCFITIATQFFVFASSSLADFSCTAGVSYKWRPAISIEQPKSEQGNEGKDGEKKEDTGVEVFFGTVQVSGATEEAAKAAIAEAINRAKTKADSACKDAHENQSKCIATKYTTNSTILHGLTFEQRKALQDGIKDDCLKANGNCLGSTATEHKCSEVVKEDEKEADKGDAKKGDGKKGDAKKK